MSHNAVSQAGAAGTDVSDEFAAAAGMRANHVAIAHGAAIITHRELDERVRRTASRYRAYGLGGPSRIGTLVSHTPAAVEHLLGVLHSGAAYCPIDAALPAARQRALAAALGLDGLFAAVPVNPRMEDGCDERAIAKQEPHRTPRQRTDPAYVLCTSGSTGSPKPVVVSRGALAVTVRALRELFGLIPEDRVLQFAALGWDTCLEEILPTLTAGATLVFDDDAHSGSFPRFVRMLAHQRVTVLDLPTAFWHELVLFLYEEHVTLPPDVRLVVIGGERVDPTRLRQWRDLAAGRVRLLNTYGCTETTMITHAVQLAGPGTEPEVAIPDAEAPLGRPLAHVRDHVADDGELLISGPALATGYLGCPELTAAGFSVADHGTGPARWFRTGDLVARGERDLLYPRGRADEQVKVLGVRVHPAEVEAQLTTHPAIAGAVVMGEDRLGQTRLAAYVVRCGPISPADLRRYLRDRLPSQFVPSRVEFVPALAYTSSGKIDRPATRRAAANSDRKGANR